MSTFNSIDIKKLLQDLQNDELVGSELSNVIGRAFGSKR